MTDTRRGSGAPSRGGAGRSGAPSRSGSGARSGAPSRSGSGRYSAPPRSGSGRSGAPSRGGSGSSRVPERNYNRSGGGSSSNSSSRVPARDMSRSGSGSGSGNSRLSGTSGGLSRGSVRNSGNVVKGGMNILLFIITILLGFGMYILSKTIFRVMEDVAPWPVIIGLIFALLFLVLNFIIMGWIKLTGDFISNKLFAENGKYIISVIVGTALAFGMGVLFQWLYQMEPSTDTVIKADEPTSLVFIIDDSGSTSTSDPQNKRYQAITDVVSKYPVGMPYMVYSFSSKVKVVRDMLPSDGQDILKAPSSGGKTEIGAALRTAYEDYEAGKWTNCGDRPKVVFLSDGAPTDGGEILGYGNILKKYADKGIVVNSVGLMYADDRVMQDIANKTGGVYISVDNAGALGNAMETVISSNSTVDTSRHLFGLRRYATNETRCLVFRLLFVLIMGLYISFFKACSVGFIESFKLTFISSIVQSVIGTVLMEFIVQAIGAESLCWMGLWILWSMTIAIRPRLVRQQVDDEYSRRRREQIGRGSGKGGESQSIDDGSSGSRRKDR